MKRSQILTVWAVLLLFLVSCKTGVESDLAIPKNAAIVFHINSASISSKLSWDEIKNTNWFRDAQSEAKDSLVQKILENPEASGIDTEKDLAFFLQRRGKGGIGVFQGGIKDAAAFEKFATSMSGQSQVQNDGEWKMLSASNTALVAWNDSRFAIINDMPEMGAMNPMARSGDKMSFGTDSLKVFVKSIMSLKGDESLFDDDRFTSLMKEKADMHLWMNSGALYSDMAGVMSMMKIGSLFENNVSATLINFDEGKIIAKSKNYFGKEMTEFLEKFDARKIDADILKRIPSTDIIGVMAANVDPESLREFIKAMGADGFLNMMMAEANITTDDLFNATNGQFVMAITDLQMKDTTMSIDMGDGEDYSHTTSAPDMSFLFASNVNKKTSFEKLMTVVNQSGPSNAFAYKLDDKWFVAGNKTAAVDGFMAGKATNHSFADKISGYPFGFYLDLSRLLKTNFTKDSAAKEMLGQSAAVWQDMVATVGEFKNGYLSSEMVINMVDKKANSLKQLNQFFEKLNTIRKKNKVAMDDDMNSDTSGFDVMVTPPPAEEVPE